jgi:hypothetical protein
MRADEQEPDRRSTVAGEEANDDEAVLSVYYEQHSNQPQIERFRNVSA